MNVQAPGMAEPRVRDYLRAESLVTDETRIGRGGLSDEGARAAHGLIASRHAEHQLIFPVFIRVSSVFHPWLTSLLSK